LVRRLLQQQKLTKTVSPANGTDNRKHSNYSFVCTYSAQCVRFTCSPEDTPLCRNKKVEHGLPAEPAALAGSAGMPLGPDAAPALPAVILPLLLGRTSVGPLLLLLLLLLLPLLLVAGTATASLLLLPAALSADAALPLPEVRAFLGGSVGVAFALDGTDC
jgi:hypothetical protein